MRIMTYNIQSGHGYPDKKILDLDLCANVIKYHNPDIVGLNEVNNGGHYGNQAEELAKKCGYPYFYFAMATLRHGIPYGNAVLSKYPLSLAEVIHIPDPLFKTENVYHETRCVLKVTALSEFNLSIYVSHFGLAEKEKKNAVKTVLKLIGKTSEKTVLMGDFNMTPDNPLIKKIATVFNDTAPDESESYFTFPSDIPKEKIDYIFVSKDIKISYAAAIPRVASDHRAYMCEIKF